MTDPLASAQSAATSLAARFQKAQIQLHYKGFQYVEGTDVVARLNASLGLHGWDYQVLSASREGDAIVVLGQLTIHLAEGSAIRQQYGGQRIKLDKAGEVIDLGDEYKAAATDALKKCALLLGVAADLEPAVEQFICQDEGCGVVIEGLVDSAGKRWTPAQVAHWSRNKYQRVLCAHHLKLEHEAAAASA